MSGIRCFSGWLRMLRKKLDQGSRCAYLYSLLMQCYDKDPSLLMELDKTVLAVLRYGQRTSLLTQELAVNISFLAQRVQDFDLLTYTVMKDVYEDYAIKDALISICEMVIRGEKAAAQIFYLDGKGRERTPPPDRSVRILYVHYG